MLEVKIESYFIDLLVQRKKTAEMNILWPLLCILCNVFVQANGFCMLKYLKMTLLHCQ